MEIKLSEEQLSEAVTKAITNSVMGERLTEMIRAEVDKAIKGSEGYPYRESVVAAIVRDVVKDAVTAAVNERREEIRQKVAESLTDEMLGQMITKLWDAALEKTRGY